MASVQNLLTPQVLTTLFVFWSLFAIPSGVILKRMGHSPAWALLWYFPVLAIIGLWVLAFGSRSSATA